MSLSVRTWSTKAAEPSNRVRTVSTHLSPILQAHLKRRSISVSITQVRKLHFFFFVEIHFIHDFLETTSFLNREECLNLDEAIGPHHLHTQAAPSCGPGAGQVAWHRECLGPLSVHGPPLAQPIPPMGESCPRLQHSGRPSSSLTWLFSKMYFSKRH